MHQTTTEWVPGRVTGNHLSAYHQPTSSIQQKQGAEVVMKIDGFHRKLNGSVPELFPLHCDGARASGIVMVGRKRESL